MPPLEPDEQRSRFESEALPWMRTLYGLAMRLDLDPNDASDLVEESYMRVYRTFGNCTSGMNAKDWLFRILINLHRDRARSRRRYEARIAAVEEREAKRGAEQIGADRQAEELSEVVREKIDSLPGRQKEVLTLHLYHEMPYGEIASTLGCSYDDVKMNLSLARRRLKDELKEYL